MRTAEEMRERISELEAERREAFAAVRVAYAAGRAAGIEEAAKVVEGSDLQGYSLACEWWPKDKAYTIGRQDAAAAIRALIPAEATAAAPALS